MIRRTLIATGLVLYCGALATATIFVALLIAYVLEQVFL